MNMGTVRGVVVPPVGTLRLQEEPANVLVEEIITGLDASFNTCQVDNRWITRSQAKN